MNLKLDFLFTDLSQHFGLHLVVFALKWSFYSWAQVRGDVKSSCVRKLKVTQPLVAYPEAFRHLPVYRWAPKLGA